MAQAIHRAAGSRALLCVPAADHVAHAWINVPDGVAVLAATEPLAKQLQAAGIAVAFGEAATGLAGFRASHGQALEAHRVALLSRPAAGTRLRFDDISMVVLMTKDLSGAQSFIDKTLGPLTADTEASRRLVTTLRIYLEEGESHVAASRRLGVHDNTVRYHVRRPGRPARRRGCPLSSADGVPYG